MVNREIEVILLDSDVDKVKTGEEIILNGIYTYRYKKLVNN